MWRLGLVLCLGLIACGEAGPSVVGAEPGEPLAGLSPDQAGQFLAGKALFDHAFTPEEGLGPLFNQRRCSSCHDLPSSGGHGAEPVTKVSHFDETVGCSLLEDEGGDLLQAIVVPAASAAGVGPELVPSSASAVVELGPPPLYALGLVAAVTDEEIRSRADPDDADGDGISGRVGRGPGGAVGRFGGKAQHATLAGFIEGAINGELGLTTPDNPAEQLPNGRPLPEGLDPAPDPEVGEEQIALLAAYVRFLAPPQRRMPEDADDQARADEGERIFGRLGCADCHTPTLVTGPSDIDALHRKRFQVYSDLLLHDMGPELADICAPGAAPSEWRTTPLVGLGHRTEFLHDNRAQGLEAAIRLHGGEGAASRDAYGNLDPEARESLMRFLRSL